MATPTPTGKRPTLSLRLVPVTDTPAADKGRVFLERLQQKIMHDPALASELQDVLPLPGANGSTEEVPGNTLLTVRQKESGIVICRLFANADTDKVLFGMGLAGAGYIRAQDADEMEQVCEVLIAGSLDQMNKYYKGQSPR